MARQSAHGVEDAVCRSSYPGLCFQERNSSLGQLPVTISEGLELNAYFNVRCIYYSKYNPPPKKNALNGRIPNGKTELNVNAEHKNFH